MRTTPFQGPYNIYTLPYEWTDKSIHCYDLFSRFEQQILFLEKQAETTEPTTERHGHDMY